jgi:RNA polymerase sigma-70 factor, ECF subfamily
MSLAPPRGPYIQEMTTAAFAQEAALLDAASGGDERAFRELVEPYRSRLQAHCYRMLGSLQDAEDAVQEALLRAWRGLPRFERRSSFKSWLYRIATNTCLRLIERRPKRVMPIEYGPAADPADPLDEPLLESVWIDPYPDVPEASYEERESVELAFIAALQHLPPRQRAVLIMRDVLNFSANEVAELLETSPAAVNSALQRAHKLVDDRLPEHTQQATLRTLGDERLRELVDHFVHAWERADVPAILDLLTDDATVAMPPRPTWFRGKQAIGAFFADVPLAPGARWRLVPTWANGQPAFGNYGWHADRDRWVLHAIDVLTISDSGIADITAFLDPELVRRFGLPLELEP